MKYETEEEDKDIKIKEYFQFWRVMSPGRREGWTTKVRAVGGRVEVKDSRIRMTKRKCQPKRKLVPVITKRSGFHNLLRV